MSHFTIQDLLYVMERLRDPISGCPWDIKQTYKTIAPYTLEEAYEVVDAIEREDYVHLQEELGDLLLQVIFYGQIANEEGRFDFSAVVDTLTKKLLRRHPHVFPDGTINSRIDEQTLLSDNVKQTWELHKQAERTEKGHASILADVPKALPALVRAQKLQKRAAKIGFDWENATEVLPKIQEELEELQDEIRQKSPHIKSELGDVLFSVVNLARHLGIDAEDALRTANTKFCDRFEFMEQQFQHQGADIAEQSLNSLEEQWQRAKLLSDRST